MKDLERAFRAACALHENGYGEYSAREYVKQRFELDDAESAGVIARAASRIAGANATGQPTPDTAQARKLASRSAVSGPRAAEPATTKRTPDCDA